MTIPFVLARDNKFEITILDEGIRWKKYHNFTVYDKDGRDQRLEEWKLTTTEFLPENIEGSVARAEIPESIYEGLDEPSVTLLVSEQWIPWGDVAGFAVSAPESAYSSFRRNETFFNDPRQIKPETLFEKKERWQFAKDAFYLQVKFTLRSKKAITQEDLCPLMPEEASAFMDEAMRRFIAFQGK